MKKIFLILIMVISTYGFTNDVETTLKKANTNNVVSICVFPSEKADSGFLFLFVGNWGLEQVRKDSIGNIPRFATCDRKTKK